MNKSHALRLAVTASVLTLAGCASVPPDQGFTDVSQAVEQRLGKQLHWLGSKQPDKTLNEQINKLLKSPMTEDRVVQLALLNSPEVQVTLEDLGMGHADLVQAGLLRNPIFGFKALYPNSGESPALDIDVTTAFLDILMVPLRQRVAAEQFAATQRQVTGKLLQYAADTRKAYYSALAAAQLHGMFDDLAASAKAALLVAEKLRAAGNITEAALAQQQLMYQEAVLRKDQAGLAAQAAREALDLKLGLDDSSQWELPGGLPRIPVQPISFDQVVQQAVDANIGMTAMTHQMEAAARELNIARIHSVIPDLELGFNWDREVSGEWKKGPIIELQVPLFDQGQAKRAKAHARLRQAQASYLAQGAMIRSSARMLKARLDLARKQVDAMLDQLLPLNQQLSGAALLEYNGMQIGVFRLLAAFEKQTATRQRFIEALRDYWMARADLETLLSGQHIGMNDMTGPAVMQGGSEDMGGH